MNETPLPGGQAPAGGPSAPISAKTCPRCGAPLGPRDAFCTRCGLITPLPSAPRPPFSASLREILAALASYLLAWLYLYRSNLFLGGILSDLFFHSSPLWSDTPWSLRIGSLVFVLGFVLLTELLHRGTPRPKESWIWLGCLGAIALGVLLNRHQVWDSLEPQLFLHLAAVWWLLSRSGRLAEGESGRLLPLDGLTGFVLIPFRHFYLRVRTLVFALSRPLRRCRKPSAVTLLWSCLALLAAAGLFALAAGLLMDADAGFSRLLSGLGAWLRVDWDGDFFGKLLLSLPVGQYLFGLLAGSGREDPRVLRERGGGLRRWLERLRRVPNALWTGLTAAFCLLYLVFFAVQSRYLFGAFTRTLPEGFIVSEYARQGFFELCKVMALNFALLWLVTRLSRVPVRENRAALLLSLILLAESLLFAAVAFSKLALYIDCFGFTPRRLQSSWLVCVLAAGCVAAARRLLTGKKSFRGWMVFSAVTLSLLCLY